MNAFKLLSKNLNKIPPSNFKFCRVQYLYVQQFTAYRHKKTFFVDSIWLPKHYKQTALLWP